MIKDNKDLINMKYTREKWIQNECSDMDKDIIHGRKSKRAYQTLKSLTKSNTKKKARVVESTNVDIIIEDTYSNN